MTQKETYFIILQQDSKIGVGECGLLRGLSADDTPDYEQKIRWACENIHLGLDELWLQLIEYPSIQFGLEMAFLSLNSDQPFSLFPSDFTTKNQPIDINGLIWMGDAAFMRDQIDEKLANGFKCVKLKIGAIDFDKEIKLLEHIRKHFSAEQIEIRVDANGAFSPERALEKLNILSQFNLHSIEQPIRAGNVEVMSIICQESPIAVALDEELIGIFYHYAKDFLLEIIRPQYIILKPSFIGGYKGTQEWISLAEKYNIGWWITSALESNIGLNAIAQWTYLQNSTLPQGLGTGGLYTNNFESPLEVRDGKLFYNNQKDWDIDIKNTFLK